MTEAPGGQPGNNVSEGYQNQAAMEGYLQNNIYVQWTKVNRIRVNGPVSTCKGHVSMYTWPCFHVHLTMYPHAPGCAFTCM
jgi:hypothetical protein